MTREQIVALEGRELRNAIAKAFPAIIQRKLDGGEWVWLPTPAVESSLDSAQLVEDEVERRGLKDAYIEELHKLIGVSWGMLWKELGWTIRRATPTQICRAALLAVLGGE